MAEEKLTFDELKENKEKAESYLNRIRAKDGRSDYRTHRRLVKNGDTDALFFDKYVQKYGFSPASIDTLIKRNFEDSYLYCVICGKRLTERNTVSKNRACSQKCAAKLRCNIIGQQISNNAQESEEIVNSAYETYKQKNDITDELDTEMKSIKKYEPVCIQHLEKICDAFGNPNTSPHKKLIRQKDKAAIIVACICKEYSIGLGELKRIIDNNYENINFFCKTCGKRLSNIDREYCSTSCQQKNTDFQNKKKEMFKEKYGVEHQFQLESVKEKTADTWEKKYGVRHNMQAEEVKAKVRRTCLEKFGETSSWKNKEVINKINISKARTSRQKLYPILLEHLKSKNLELLTSYDAYLNGERLRFKCTKCGKEFDGDFHAYIQYYINRIICDECNERVSKGEENLYYFIKDLLPNEEILRNKRKILGDLELDIYVPSKKLAIEFDGIYWHSSNKKDIEPNYHINKTLACQEKGIQLIHVFENEWAEKSDIVKSVIKSKLGLYDKRIYARKCEVKELSDTDYCAFLIRNHLQGYSPSKIRLGLLYEDELVACVGIGGSRFSKDETELIRFCTKLNTQVVGGLSKLIKSSGVKKMSSYLDLRYFNGKGYEAIGFKYLHRSKPGYVYIRGHEILSRMQCQKHLLPKLLGEKFNPDLTEAENMAMSGYCQIYDCGMLKYEYDVK